MLFQDIPGHNLLKEKIITSVKKGKLGHALLFTGDNYSAVLPFALATTTYLMCTNRGESDACGQCAACVKNSGMIHPDVHYSFPVFKSGSAKQVRSEDFYDTWRETLAENPFLSVEKWFKVLGIQNQQATIYTAESDHIVSKIAFKAYESDRKVVLIWLPEKLESEAANKLLKSIEEPPDETYFFLVSHEPEKILPTILSRCQKYPVPATATAEISKYLIRKHQVSEEKANQLAAISGGNPGKAIEEILAPDDGARYFEYFVTWMRLCYAFNITGLTEWIEEISGTGREHQKSFLSYVLHMFRENMILHHQNSKHYLSDEERKFSEKFSEFIHNRNILQLNDVINQAYLDIENNGNARIVFMDTSFKIHHLIKN